MSSAINIFWPKMLFIAPFLQAVAFLIETSSWLVRAQSASGQLGLYVGRSNIYLYFARMFTLLFTASLALSVEVGQAPKVIYESICATFIVSSLLHFLLIIPSSRHFIIKIVSTILFLPNKFSRSPNLGANIFSNKLFWLTSVTSLIFSVSLTAPILGAILFPEFRLSISYVGQVINFFGTIIILFFVDQILFRAIDSNEIEEILVSYIIGRLCGFFVVGIAFLLIGYGL